MVINNVVDRDQVPGESIHPEVKVKRKEIPRRVKTGSEMEYVTIKWTCKLNSSELLSH